MPSAVIRVERNLLLHPLPPEAAGICRISDGPFPFDPRLLGRSQMLCESDLVPAASPAKVAKEDLSEHPALRVGLRGAEDPVRDILLTEVAAVEIALQGQDASHQEASEGQVRRHGKRLSSSDMSRLRFTVSSRSRTA